ncbi:DinB family protein [Mucilaginibacter sp. RS28]|uniref:DinB family protein n=1 Tax=Mucilaginibacter straminoryzae TaxID=2932774 RepID=A0A9X1X4K1_9SPHI|nr:DinB family protein [Mucilaginibacter straminoryzae]MCJ8210848.1 DinB family protein [Mucilaginibacter straminoryzae]
MLPDVSEYAPFYANYVETAAQLGDIVETLNRLAEDTYQFLITISKEKQDYAYAPGKWTIRQLVSHLIDAERVFAYRLLCISRGEQQPLPGFEENSYVEHAELQGRTLENMADEFKQLRLANLFLIHSLTAEQLALSGIASGNRVTVNALLYIMAGHELHHLRIIKERYL